MSATPSPNISAATTASNSASSAQVQHQTRVLYECVKRSIDVLVSMALLTLLSPLWLLAALLIKLDSRGPVFFQHLVMGKDEVPFTLYKFRSMRPGSMREDHREDVRRNFIHGEATTRDAEGKPIYKTALMDQKRITRVGKFLRRTSLDEVPQLWNVLLGHMSLVGPRPALPYETQFYEESHRRRFLVRPGITGLYQVSARNRVPITEMLRIDLEYVRTRSLWLDLKIVAKTPRAMFSGM